MLTTFGFLSQGDTGDAFQRSDDLSVYDNLDECLEAVISDYGTSLTQDVTITALRPITQVTEGRAFGKIFYTTIHDFNFDSEFFLTIDGTFNLTIDCHSLGGIKLNNCSNFIFKNINFSNTSNNIYDYAPEQTCAVFAQGSSNGVCKNIIIDHCSINGFAYFEDEVFYGSYAFVFKYIKNVSIVNTSIQGFSAYGMDVSNLGALSLSNVTFTSCFTKQGIISQPCYINVKSTELLYIEDSTFDLTNFDTGVIGSNLIRLVATRSKFINANGEVFRLGNTIDMELLDITSCLISNNLTNPYYGYIKQYIAFDTIKKINILNNTVRIMAIKGLEYYARFLKGVYAAEINSFNNIFDYVAPDLTNNAGEIVLYNIATIDAINSNNNIYHDKLQDTDTLYNLVMIVTDTDSPIYFSRLQKLSGLHSISLDLDSSFIDLSIPIFIDNDVSQITEEVIAHPVSLANTPTYDLNKNTTTVYNLGAYQAQGVVPPIDGVYSYKGIDTFEEELFSSALVHSSFSSTTLLLTPVSNEKGVYCRWIFEDEDLNTTISIGVATAENLFSRLDVNGVYTGNLSYNVELLKN